MWVDTCVKWLRFAQKVASISPREKAEIKSALEALERMRRREVDSWNS